MTAEDYEHMDRYMLRTWLEIELHNEAYRRRNRESARSPIVALSHCTIAARTPLLMVRCGSAAANMEWYEPDEAIGPVGHRQET